MKTKQVKNVIDYQILSSLREYELSKEVSSFLNKGYKLRGKMQVLKGNVQILFIQIVTKNYKQQTDN